MNPLDRLDRWARLLDDVFRVPFTRIRFGWDPILGLLPVIGDLTSPIFGAIVVAHGVWLGVPKIILLRVIVNCAIDAGIGSLPIVGDIFDVFWPANAMNFALLRQHARRSAERGGASSRPEGVPASARLGGVKGSPPPKQCDVRPRVWDYVFVFSVFGIALFVVLIPFIILGWGIAKVVGWL